MNKHDVFRKYLADEYSMIEIFTGNGKTDVLDESQRHQYKKLSDTEVATAKLLALEIADSISADQAKHTKLAALVEDIASACMAEAVRQLALAVQLTLGYTQDDFLAGQ